MSRETSFWARRKARVEAEAQSEQAAAEARSLAEEQAAYEDMTDAEVLAAFDLPDPDTLKAGDDFTAFMAKAIPDHLRRRALRTLWRSNPVLANVDMLVDYGEDYTDSAMVVENMQTAYQVGKGMLKHVEEMARQAKEREALSEPEAPDETPEDEDVLVALSEEGPTEEEIEVPEMAEAEMPEHDTPEHVTLDHDTWEETELASLPPAPRRMKFRLEEDAA